ncbi:MAG TPA: hypothetical protein VFL85_05270, partial [Candidatus Saccharimonadales bacterium]|nr:hypothetical protein [Candidatus Saccharimonadales bacterium]
PPPPPPKKGKTACGIADATYVYNLENYNFPDWKVKYYDQGKYVNKPLSDTYHPVSIPAGTYRFGAGASDNHPNPGATNRRLHYNFYNGTKLIAQTPDTPNMPPSKILIEVTGTITLPEPATAIKVEHGPIKPSNDDSIDSGCLALGP